MCFLRAFLLLLLLLLGCPPLATATCPHWCSCTDDIIDCKGLGLSEDDLPTSLASSTRRLYLNNNQLTFIPSGFFDRLKNLHTVSLWGNPWDCTCNILYLRSWLQWQQNRTMYRNIVCTSPAHLEGRIVTYLLEDEILSTCQYWYCSMALIMQICLFLFILVQAILLFVVLVYVRRFQRIAKEARRTTAEISEYVGSWRAADMEQDD
ncbi:platelet glycoprotein Ib beta chain [Varanus komodoensis]|uniref:platelet glycoprotein Ib beta chain n=1 Tax=Varanus komodoensis TaxID=61221 RepID=UPI001CF7D8C5|nr:platelet glycoprotein Ib beta chain [Varanus komodoensis]XP_044296771.1 platelet glycoprotein Ib beta chain [Varanus komodoensis]